MKKLWHIVLACVNLALAAAVLLSAYGGTVSPESGVIPALAAMVFPLLLPVLLLALVASFFVSWKGVVFNSVVLLCCSGPILDICPLNFDSSERVDAAPAGTCFSVMTYNVFGLNNVEGGASGNADTPNPTLDYIIKSGYDIVAYQEAYDFNARHYMGVPQRQLEALRAAYPYMAYSENSEIGILSKYPVKKISVNIADTESFFIGRYEVDVHGTKVTVINLHLQSIGLNDDDKRLYRRLTSGHTENMDTVRHTLLHKLKNAFHARARQAIKVRHLVDEISGPVIVCGDFNDIPGSYAQRAIQGHDLKDAYRDAGLGPAVTYHANRFYFRIDQVLYRGISPLKAVVGGNPTSDHYPVCVMFSTVPDLHN